jgi:hypothetical protein
LWDIYTIFSRFTEPTKPRVVELLGGVVVLVLCSKKKFEIENLKTPKPQNRRGVP